MDNVTDISQVQHSDSQLRDFRVVRVDPLTIDPKEVEKLWNKIKTQEYVFDDFSKGDATPFLMTLVEPNSLHFLIGDSAYVQIRQALPGQNGVFHFARWDNNCSVRRLISAGKEIFTLLFQEVKINRLTTYVPSYNKPAERFTTLFGFRYEGTIRQGVKFDGTYHDLFMYGLLKKEFKSRYEKCQ